VSTRCNIAIRHEDGSVIGTSVHWDGYPANMTPTIVNYVTERTVTDLFVRIAEAASKGGFESFVWDSSRWAMISESKITFSDDEAYSLDADTILDPERGVPYTYIVNVRRKLLEIYEMDYDINQLMLRTTVALPVGCV
tara:strand:- start:1897 stop:2310 length:414 start_codon:yes stop_codon:yes gene_type:complete